MMITSKTAMRRARVRFNYNDYLLLPEDKRYEILDGDLFVVAAPNTKHQRISLKLAAALLKYVEDTRAGEILQAPYDVVLSEENVVQPDILFVRKARRGIIGEKNIQGAPDLVIEIVSTGTRNRDLELKSKIYGQFGVREYWIVDPETDTVEVRVWSEQGYASAGVYGKSDRLSSPQLPELNLLLAEMFI
jgi:Uma2 family endonuclease